MVGPLGRWAAQQLGRLRGRAYAAAKSGGTIGSWYPASQDVNAEISSSSASINARVRQLVRDFPQASRAVDVLSGWIVGAGITLQSRVTRPDGSLDKALNRQIEDAWKWWGEEADLSRRLHLYDMQALCVRQLTEIGEFCLVKTATAAPDRYLPFALRIIEADRLGAFASRPLPGNEEYAGIEWDPRTGATQAYWFSDDATVGINRYGAVKTGAVRLPANRVIHGFPTLRPGQLRGVSPFAPAVLLAHDLHDYLDAEIDGAKMAARFLSFIKTSNPAGTMGAFGAVTHTETQRKTEEIGTAIQQYLLPDEDVTIASHNRPGDSFAPFTRFILQSFAAVLGVPYELLSGNYDGMNYTVLRGVRNDFAQHLATLRAKFIRQFCLPVQREFMNWLALTGRVALPGYFADPWPYLRSVWLGPGMLEIDPLKEGRANIDAIAGLLKSPQETILSRGRDPEEVLDELAEWKQLCAERGLEAEEAAEPLKSNPAALQDEEDDERSRHRRFRRVK